LHYFESDSDPYIESLNILLSNKADINAIDWKGDTPLHISDRHPKIARILVEHGANINAKNHKGWKPFQRWIGYPNMTSIETLKEWVLLGGNVHEFMPDGHNILHRVCFSSYSHDNGLTLMKFLIEEKGMNINQNGIWSDGKNGASTPFAQAVLSQQLRKDNFEILEYLIGKGADFNAKVFHKPEEARNVYIIHNSILALAKNQQVPPYIIDWLIQRGAR